MIRIISIILTTLLLNESIAQNNIYFIEERTNLVENILSSSAIDKSKLNSFLYQDKYIIIARLNNIPTSTPKNIELLSYLGNNYYWVAVDKNINSMQLVEDDIISIYTPKLELKTTANILFKNYPIHAVNEADYIDVSILLYKPETKGILNQELKKIGAYILPTISENTVFYPCRVPIDSIDKLIMLPFIHFVEAILEEAKVVNYDNNATHGNFYLKSKELSERGLTGKGVVVGEGDDGNITSHIDYSDRVIDRASYPFNSHGTHVGGTIAGAGILNPLHEGMAPKATLIGEYFTNIIGATDQHVRDFNMVLTNNSYYSGAAGCTSNGTYSSSSNFADIQQVNNDTLLHVFAAGNDGGSTCAPYPAGFHTVKSNWQIAKNTLVVANMQESYTIAPSSSRGPTDDGRIKPEITAIGTAVNSTYPNNTYASISGTSMASPTVTGTLALLCERYRQTHSGSSPIGGLLKAIACNTASDWGNTGPDYTFGYGIINSVRAVRAIENNQFIINNVSHGVTNTHNITIPSGAQQLKVTLYWVDVAGDPVLATNLVNNLDLSVTTPSTTTILPWVLNQTPASVNALALRGRDSLNNIEQVTIDNPASGIYTLQVNGYNVPIGAQRYILTYDIVTPSVEVLWPNGGDPIRANTTVNIQWNAFGGDPNTFTVEYSLNNGVSWTTIVNNAASNLRRQSWVVPNTSTNQALVRVIRNVVGYADTSNTTFVILPQTTISNTTMCEGHILLTWLPIAGATSYDLMMKVGDSMQVIKNTLDTFNYINGLSPTTTYYYAVRGKISSSNGMRSNAINVTPASGTCVSSLFDNDMKLVSINNNTGRINTSSALRNNVTISIGIKNLDNVATTGSYNLYYQINGGSPIMETISTSIASLATLNYNFTSVANLSAIGTYTIKAWVRRTGDLQFSNDTIEKVIRQLSNPIVVLPALENFETLSDTSYSSTTIGLIGDDRLDFYTISGNRNRARTYVSNSICNNGSRAFSMDAKSYGTNLNVDNLYYTLNMSSYNTSQEIKLDFYYMHHGNTTHANDRVWIRGSDTSAWIEAYNLFTNQAGAGVYKLVNNINLSNLLAANAQSYSSSFQIRFGWEGVNSINNIIYTDGYSFDDINVYQIVNDISVLSVNSPGVFNCSLSATTSINASVRNNVANTINNIPVAFRINNTVFVYDTIPTITGNTTINHTFAIPANLSALGIQTIDILSNLAGDSYRLNDTLKSYTIINSPSVSNYPYLEEFEANNGNYIAFGNSWTWGTPTKSIINKAANGTKAWVTRISGNYADNTNTVLYSPCFDLSSLTNPVLSFSHIYQTENGWDFMWVEYSTNNGNTWTKLGAVGSGTNWYNDVATNTWDNITNTKWHVASCPIPTTSANTRFRYVFTSDGSVTFEGVGIDDIHIFDRQQIYSGVSNPVIASQNINGSNWVHFTNAGLRVASVNSNGQNLGNTSCNVYINTSGIRNNSVQYYLDRNIVINPVNTPTLPVTIRMYFTYAEAQELILASGCGVCTSIADAYESGITKFHGNTPSIENGTIADNIFAGIYSYILPNDVKIIPYDNGYYAEFNVNSFSEFWINDGGLTNSLPLPVEWLSFDVEKINNDAIIKWSTASEINCDYFQIEVAKDDALDFYTIGKVNGAGFSSSINSYEFIDPEMNKINTRYYRIRQIDLDNKEDITPIKYLNFSSNQTIHISPNPFNDELNIYYSDSRETLYRYELTNIQGQLVMRNNFDDVSKTTNYKINNLQQIGRGNYILKLYNSENLLLKTIHISKLE
jgi:hypothetical protein